MENSLSEIVPLVALRDLVNVAIPFEVEEFQTVELLIQIENFDLNIREFSAFLSFIDRVYGHMKDWNLSSYSHLPARQLKIETIRNGSIEIVISEFLIQAKANLIPLVVVVTALAVIKPRQN